MALPGIYRELQAFVEDWGQGVASAGVMPELERFIAAIPPTFPELSPAACSLAVEIHKQLHLLKTDVLFWQAARQPITQAQRRQQMQQRLQLLQSYLDQLAGMGDG
ncbi:MAG: heterocyst frequency control protein PatD [Gloeomargarita sp. GMQP_bins_120]